MTKSLPFSFFCLVASAALFAQASRPGVAGRQRDSLSPANTAEVQRGKKVFDSKCAICHFPSSPAKKIGPGLKDLYKRGTYTDGRQIDDASLRAWIERGSKQMPGLKASLNPEQIRDLIAYLKML